MVHRERQAQQERQGRRKLARREQPPVKIRASRIIAPSNWTPLLVEKPDVLKHQALQANIEVQRKLGF
jgi:hypothetical protein